MVAAINTGLGGAEHQCATASSASLPTAPTALRSGRTRQIARAPNGNRSSSASTTWSAATPARCGLLEVHGQRSARLRRGQTAQIVLRDSSGRALTSYTRWPRRQRHLQTISSAISTRAQHQFRQLQRSTMPRPLRFQPAANVAGATLSIQRTRPIASAPAAPSPDDEPYRRIRRIGTAQVRPDYPRGFVEARLRAAADVAPGAKALGSGDTRGATAFVSFGSPARSTWARTASPPSMPLPAT